MICSEYFVEQSIEPWISYRAVDFLQSFSPLVHSSSFLLACNSNLPIPEAIEISFGSYSSYNHLFVLQTCHRDVALFHLLDSHELLSPSVQKGKSDLNLYSNGHFSC